MRICCRYLAGWLAGREASAGVGTSVYERHRPERTLLYQLVEDCYPALKTHLAAQGTTLAGYVEREFEAYLKCGRLEHGFLRVRCETCHAEQLLAFSAIAPALLYLPCPCGRAASGAVSVPAAVPVVWLTTAWMQEPEPRVMHCWLMRCFPHSRCASEC